MPLGEVVLLGAVQGIADALPLSGAAHSAIARIWLPPSEAGGALEGFFELGTALAVAFSIRRRVAATFGEGIRAIARPALVRSSPGARDAALVAIAGVSAGLARALLAPFILGFEGAPLAIGSGLLVTAAALVTTSFAPRGKLETPTFGGAVAVGVAVGLAVMPGISAIAAALTALVWLGVRPARAVDLALLLALPPLALSSARHLVGPHQLAAAGVSGGLVAAGLLVAFLSASLACTLLRALFERRRLAVLALWLTPLGLATIAYARALPDASTEKASPAAPTSSNA